MYQVILVMNRTSFVFIFIEPFTPNPTFKLAMVRLTGPYVLWLQNIFLYCYYYDSVNMPDSSSNENFGITVIKSNL